MKTLLSVIFSIILFAVPVSAKSGSGGQPAAPAPVPEVSTPAPTPTSTSSGGGGSVPAASEPEKKPEAKAEVKKPAPMTEQEKKALKGKKHCGELATVEERINCRLHVSPEVIQTELDTAYFPEGCRALGEDWQAKCKDRYKSIGSCWDKTKPKEYDGKDVIACLKKKLVLDPALKPVAAVCKKDDQACREAYKKKIWNLIVARLYDAEQRAELLMQEGKITKEQTIEFIIKISKAKLDFYNAKNKGERVAVIQRIVNEWKELLKKIK